MSLSPVDRKLLQRCLAREEKAWNDFIDRFLGLVLHVVRHTARARSVALEPSDEEDLAGEVFLQLLRDDYALLRRFRGAASLATYLSVVARRVVVHQLKKRRTHSRLTTSPVDERQPEDSEQRITNREEVERLLKGLNDSEADVVRLYHLEGRSYQEISKQVGMPENSVGPLLSRAREKMRQAGTA